MNPHVEFDIEIEAAQRKRKEAIAEAEVAARMAMDEIKGEMDEEEKAYYMAGIRYNVAVAKYNEEREKVSNLYRAVTQGADADYDDEITEARLKFREAVVGAFDA